MLNRRLDKILFSLTVYRVWKLLTDSHPLHSHTRQTNKSVQSVSLMVNDYIHTMHMTVPFLHLTFLIWLLTAVLISIYHHHHHHHHTWRKGYHLSILLPPTLSTACGVTTTVAMKNYHLVSSPWPRTTTTIFTTTAEVISVVWYFRV